MNMPMGIWPSACSPPWKPPRPREATCAAGSRRLSSWFPPRLGAGRGWTACSTCAWKIIPSQWKELRRLVRLARAYHKLNEGDELVTAGDMEAAMDAYRAATELVPDEATGGEAPFWVGVTLVSEGREEEAVPYLRRAQAQSDRWADLLRRLPASGLLPADDGLLGRLTAAMVGE